MAAFGSGGSKAWSRLLGCWGAGVLEDLGGLEFRAFRASGSRVSGSGRCLELASCRALGVNSLQALKLKTP